MSRPNPLGDQDNIISFGKNVYACCEIAGMTIESLSIRTDVAVSVFDNYRKGERHLSQADIDAVCSEFGLKLIQLVHNYGPEEHQRSVLRNLLTQAGYRAPPVITPESPVEEPPPANEEPESAGATSAELLTADDQVETPKSLELPATIVVAEEFQGEPTTPAPQREAITVSWNDDDLIGSASSGEDFDLVERVLRRRLIEFIQNAVDRKDISFKAFIQSAGLNKHSSWKRGVELGTTRIYGTEVEAIAKALEMSAYALLVGSGNQPQKLPEPKPKPKVLPSTETRPPEFPVLIPAISREQDYFRSLVLNRDTEPASGVTFGALLELARDQEGVDWLNSYLTLTKAGEEFASYVASIKVEVNSLDQQLRWLFLKELTEVCG